MPAGSHRDKEGLAEGCLVFEQLGDEIRLVFEACEGLLSELLTFAVELVGEPLQEQHAEDELLKLRGVHLAAQEVGGLQEEGLELGEGDFLLFHRLPPLMLPPLRSHLLFERLPDQAHHIGQLFRLAKVYLYITIAPATTVGDVLGQTFRIM